MSDNFWQLLCAVLGGSGLWELLKFEKCDEYALHVPELRKPHQSGFEQL